MRGVVWILGSRKSCSSSMEVVLLAFFLFATTSSSAPSSTQAGEKKDGEGRKEGKKDEELYHLPL